MRILDSWRLTDTGPSAVRLDIEGRHEMRIEALGPALFRVRLLKDRAWRLDRSWTVAPGGTMPPEGRSRDSFDGFTCPDVTVRQGADGLIVEGERLRAIIRQPLQIAWQARQKDGCWHDLAQDRPTAAYMLGRRGHAVSHFLRRHPDERVYGLGEKAGLLERSGRRFEMRNLDAMGYDAASTDPLYKHIPFTLTHTPDAGSFSLFYDTLAGCWFDLGNELDNYHAPYRAFRAEDGDLDYYIAWAPAMRDLVKAQQWLTGGMAFPPRWSLGYSGSTMAYTDAPDAQARMAGFLRALEDHDIPCDSFHLSSGYTSIGGKRHVFNWNSDKFPDPEGFAAAYAGAGLHLIANIKPCLLTEHPHYGQAAEQGLFIRDSETGAPELSVFWDARGSHLDFTNPDTLVWWRENVTRALLARGLGSTWNDNNEFEVWDHHARCAGFGRPIDMGLIRPLHALLMVQASEAAQRAHAPERRPFLVTRSGCAGLQRHAQTWTGDNRTSWDSLRWNIRMGLGLALSGISNIGHDVGGFSGPQPDAELLLRWVQNGALHPRFVIHSWNDDGSVTEPWTHPEVLPLIRAAMALRYRLMPYLYTCLWRAVTEAEPMIRPSFLDHEDDAQCFADSDDFLLGGDLLVASVVEKGATERRVYLPRNGAGWWDYHAGMWHPGGQWLTLPVTLATMPLFVRAGAILPLGCAGARRADAAGAIRALAVFPAPGQRARTSFAYEDSGDNADALSGRHALCRMELQRTGAQLSLRLARSGELALQAPDLRLILPADGRETLRCDGRLLRHGDMIPAPN